MRFKRQFTKFMLVFLLMLTACKEGKSDAGIPIVPIILPPFEMQDSGNKVDNLLRIKKCHVYSFALRFDYKEKDQADRARVRKLVGGHETDKTGAVKEPGIQTPVRLKVSEISEDGNERLIFEKEGAPILTSWGADSFSKRIGKTVLQPGIYRISLDLLTDAPDYIGTPAHLTIGYNPKTLPSDSVCPN